MKFSKREKILLILFIIAYVVVGIINMKELSKTPMSEAFKNLGRRWIVNIGGFRMNPMTVIMGLFIALILIVIAYKMGRNFKLIPDRKQSFFEYLMEFVYEIVEEAIPDPKLVRPTFVLAITKPMITVMGFIRKPPILMIHLLPRFLKASLIGVLLSSFMLIIPTTT